MKRKNRWLIGSFIAMVCFLCIMETIFPVDKNPEKSEDILSEELLAELATDVSTESESGMIAENSEEIPDEYMVMEESEEISEGNKVDEHSENFEIIETAESITREERSEECSESGGMIEEVDMILESHVLTERNDEISESIEIVEESIHVCSFVIQEVLPTCLLAGKREIICPECGRISETQFLEAIGHDYVKSIWESATCMKGGYYNSVCQRCGVVESVTEEALPHEIEDIVVQEGNCMQDTIIRHICKYCQNQIGTDTRYTPQLHSWKEAVVDEESVTYCEWCGVLQ